MAFASWADLFKNKPEVTEGMEDVARRSFPGKMSEYGGELTAEQLDALNSDQKLLEEFQKSKAATAPKPTNLISTGKSVPELMQGEQADTLVNRQIKNDDLFQNIQRSSETPNISSKLDNMEDITKQLESLPEEQLSQFGKLGEMIKNSKAAKLLGKAAPVLGGLGAGLEAKAAGENLAEGKYPEVAGNALGAASGIAAMTGSPIAAPLGLASLGVAGGMQQGRQQAETGVDEMGMQPVPTEQTFSGNQSPPQELAASQQASIPPINDQITPPPTKGMGPLANIDQYHPSVSPPEEEDVGEMGGDTSMLVNKPAVNPNQEKIDQLIKMQDTMGTLENLRAAQSRASDTRASADLMAAGDKFGAGLAGAISGGAPSKTDTAFTDNLRKGADQPVEDLGKQLEMEKDDPNSAYSKNFRDFATPLARQNGVTIPQNMSARQIASIIPQLEKMYDSSLKRTEATAKASASKEEKDTKYADKKNTEQGKRLTKLNDRLTSEIASGRTVLGKAANIKRSAQAIEQLLNQYPDLNDMDARQIKEVARNLDAMLSSSAATVSGTAGLIPSSMSGDMAKIEEYIGNIPKGAKQGKFVQRMLETVIREKDLADEQIKGTQNKLLAGYQDLKGTPELDEIMEIHGLNPTPKSTESSKSSQPKSEQPKSTPSSKPGPGSIVNIKGKRYQVGADGDSLKEI